MGHNTSEQGYFGGVISRKCSQIYNYWSHKDPENRLGHKNAALRNKCLGLCSQNPNSGGLEKSEPRRNRWHKITIS